MRDFHIKPVDAATVDPLALVAQYRSHLQQGQAAIRERYLASGDAPRLLHERCCLIDEVLCDLWRSLQLPASLALLAVGGYGRGELYPASDVDLLLLLPAPPDGDLTTQLEQAVTLCYDIGLEVAPSVRTVDECSQAAASDLTIQTALLEARLLIGSDELFQAFSAALEQVLDPLAFFEAKRSEQDERHLRYDDTPYSLSRTARKARGDCVICKPSSGLPARQATALPGQSWRNTVF